MEQPNFKYDDSLFGGTCKNMPNRNSAVFTMPKMDLIDFSTYNNM